MKTIILTERNCQYLGGGRVAFGQQDFSCRGGSYSTYEVRLSARAAEYLSNGDTLRWWDGPSELPWVSCGGEILKRDGRRVQLTGSRDVGIDTGHPPHLGLKMKTRKGLVWDWDSQGESFCVAHSPWGMWYKYSHCPPGIWGIKTHQEFLDWASDVQPFDGKTIVVSRVRRLCLVIKDAPDVIGWRIGTLVPQVKLIGDVSTDEPIIL